MADAIDFYFDFSSPYGYLASTRIDELAARHGRLVRWRPFLIGALYKQLGYMPLEQPGKRAYFLHDVPRSARVMGVKLTIPASFPEALIAPARALYWIADRDEAKAAAFGAAAYRAYWSEGRKLADPQVVAEIATAQGFAEDTVLAARNDPKVKDRLKRKPMRRSPPASSARPSSSSTARNSGARTGSIRSRNGWRREDGREGYARTGCSRLGSLKPAAN